VDLDVLIERGCVARAVRALRGRGFRVVVAEPYTVTMERRGFIVDLYTEPAFAWVVYMDGGRLLRGCSEDVELAGVPARGLSRGAEVAVAAAHAVYKVHMVLLMDCLVAWSWLDSEAWKVAVDCGVEAALVERAARALRCEVGNVLGMGCGLVRCRRSWTCKGWGPEERENFIVHVGTRLVKNPRVSVEAVEILRRRGFDVKLVVVGPPSAGIESRAVEWRFSIPEREKVELLRRAKALALLSSYETFSYVCLEAMVCKAPERVGVVRGLATFRR